VSDYQFSLNVAEGGVRFEPGDRRIRFTYGGVPFPRTIPITWGPKQDPKARTFEPTWVGLSGGGTAILAGGIKFETQVKLPPRGRVNTLVVKFSNGDVVRGLQIIADLDGQARDLGMHGGREGETATIKLEDGEHIIGVDGCTGTNGDAIRIYTNRRVIGPFGNASGGDHCYHFFRAGHPLDLSGWPHKSHKSSDHCHRGELPIDGEVIGFYGKVHDNNVITQVGVIARSIGHIQSGWRWCRQCSCLVFREGLTSPSGVCQGGEVGGSHVTDGSYNYGLICHGPWPGTQPEWKQCDRCRALYQFTNPIPSHCPAGGPHASTSSRVYSLYHDIADPFGQDGWRWCGDCGALFHPQVAGACPARKDGHGRGYSFNYRLMTR
jgi:hypothetical protein